MARWNWFAKYTAPDGSRNRISDCTAVYRLMSDLLRVHERNPQDPEREMKAEKIIEYLEMAVAKAKEEAS